MPKKKKKGCPTPHKVKYNKGLDAYRALVEIQAKHNPLHKENRVYKCRCGKYHLSSQEVYG